MMARQFFTAQLCFLVTGWLCAAYPARAELAHMAMQAPLAGGAVDTSRIVSVGGAVTEILYQLGFADRIIAVDSTSLYPAQAQAKPDVGYMRQLSAEPILALEPTLVLAIEDAGPPEVLTQLKQAGVQVIMIGDTPDASGVAEKITQIAGAVDVPERGMALREQVTHDLEQVRSAIAKRSARPRVLFLLSVGQGGAPMAAGRDTSAAGIIELAGGINAIDAFEGFKPLSPEALVAAAPDFILLTNRSLALLGGKQGVRTLPEISLSSGVAEERIIAMDALLLLGFGPRIAEAASQLAHLLHPELSPVSVMGLSGAAAR